jgi:ADP-ribose pyrophosphatase YjhB (NUDIX family)
MKRVLAAGGIVLNQHKELLMIFRRTKWDLPKGHYEWNENMEECALREVMEETGVRNLHIVRLVGVTEHVYFDNLLKSEAIKEIHWYEMKGDKNDPLKGQVEESIEWVSWVPIGEIDKYLYNSYPNIREILLKAGVASHV